MRSAKNKDDFDSLNNWRGIVLLDIVSKVFAALLEERLRELAEKVLSDSEVGYRKAQGAAWP